MILQSESDSPTPARGLTLLCLHSRSTMDAVRFELTNSGALPEYHLNVALVGLTTSSMCVRIVAKLPGLNESQHNHSIALLFVVDATAASILRQQCWTYPIVFAPKVCRSMERVPAYRGFRLYF